jgi:adenylosuccinate synthase
MRALAIIGAAYGDEGKGLAVDHAATADSLVVRFNGGAQAGHTVVTPDGRRHVFSHFGSGSFRGAATYLSRFFVSNPILFRPEYVDLAEMRAAPTVYAHPDSFLSTPFDMMFNEMQERRRGPQRHGSVGVGFGETIERCTWLDARYRTTVDDVFGDNLRAKLARIQEDWVPRRAIYLGLTRAEVDKHPAMRSEVVDRYIDDCAFFANRVHLSFSRALQHDRIIFEGAQGLELDQSYGAFPHVTRSHTGLRNVMALLPELGVEHLAVQYMTRAYTTRHGAGPLKGELSAPPAPLIHDETNVPNEFQGTLRFGHLDLDRLSRAIRYDIEHAIVPVDPRVMITCMDQMEETATLIRRGVPDVVPRAMLPACVEMATSLPALTSWGATRDAVVPRTSAVAA